MKQEPEPQPPPDADRGADTKSDANSDANFDDGESILPSPINEPPLVRLVIVLVLTLLPWPAVWYGMYELHSIAWSFLLYHGVCLLPTVMWGWPLWKGGLKLPSKRQAALLSAAMIATSLIAWTTYTFSGSMIIERADVMYVLTERGYLATWLLPLSAYFIVINASLEELFWRGVILNELDFLNRRLRYAGEAWTALSFGAWHWLVLRLLLKPVWAELAVLGVLAVGIICSWVYRKTGSIILAILCHALVFDLALIVVLILLQAAAVQ